MKRRTTIAAIAAASFGIGFPIGALSSDSGAESTNPIDQPSTWFVTCHNAQGHSILGGRTLVNGHGNPVELVGPVAVTVAGALAFARQADLVFPDGECEPTHLHEVWMISAPWGPTEIGTPLSISR